MAGRTSARSRARVAGLGTALLAVMLVAGCGDSEEPDGSSSPTATTSVTETATESPTTATSEPTETWALPALPDEATENTPEGAEAFIRYYFDVANGLYQNPPATDEISGIVGSELVDPECISCETLRSELTQLSESGQRTLGDLYTIDSMERIGGGAPDVQRFNMVMTLNDHVIETTDSGEQDEYSGGRVEGVGAAKWTGTQWVIYDMELG